MAAMMTPPIHIITPVWGASYTRCFLDVGMASLLAPGNLPVLTQQSGHMLHVFATEADREVIERSSIWQRAREYVHCQIDIIGAAAVAIADPHRMMSECHREAIAFANAQGAATMFYNPDIVLADGGMQALVRLLAEGKRAVQVVGLRLRKDDVIPLLLQGYASSDHTSISISPRDLMAIAIKHLHPISMMHMYEGGKFDLMPQELFWRVDDEGIIARCFHIHPILVFPRNRNAKFTTTVDDDYLQAACPDVDDVHIISDSDEFCLCELSGPQRWLTGLPRFGTNLTIAQWAWANTRPHHLEHFCRRIVLHSGRVQENKWVAAYARSDLVVREIFKQLLTIQAANRPLN